MKKLISFILIFILIVSMLNVPVYAVGSFAGGDGSAANPYQITNWTQLNEVRNHLSSHFMLMNDLKTTDADYASIAGSSANSGLGWDPIGDNTNRFKGRFDGNGKTISGLTINRPLESNIGLFAYTGYWLGETVGPTVEITNIQLKDVSVKGKGYVGGLAGWVEHTKISDSYVTGTIIGSPKFDSNIPLAIGGLVGYLRGEVTTSYADADVTGYNIVGGLVGYVTKPGKISNSYSRGSVKATINSTDTGEVGGLVGRSYATITNCYTTATVTGTVEFFGFLIGFHNDGNATACFYDGTKAGAMAWDSGFGWKPSDFIVQHAYATTTNMKKKATFTAKGWDFDNIWAIDEGTSYPYFKPKLIEVSFDMIDNTVKAPSSKYYAPDTSLTYGTDLPDSKFVRVGYSFNGWNTKADGTGTTVTSSSNITVAADHILYAQWEGNPITVNFNQNGGTETPSPSSINATVGAIYGELPTYSGTKAGYEFDGWATATTGGIKVTSSSSIEIPNTHTLYALWKGNTYNVSFNANGGTNPPTQTAIYGSSYGILPHFGITTISGISCWFDGWYTQESGGSLVTTNTALNTDSDHTLYAHWSEITPRDLTYDGNGNTTGTAITISGINPGTIVTVTGAGILEKTGYTFAGWNSEADGTGDSYAEDSTFTMQNNNLTLYAKWNPNNVTVTFNTQVDVPTSSSITTEFDTNYLDIDNVKSITRTGYDLIGWFKEQVLEVTSTWNSTLKEWVASTQDEVHKVKQDTKLTNPDPHTLYAQWAPKIFHITFNPNGGAVDGSGVDAISGATAIYDFKYGQLKNATREGYTLEGWYTATSGGIKIESTSKVAITTDTALYARWTPKTDTPYTVGHYKQDVLLDVYVAESANDIETKVGTTGETATMGAIEPNTYTGFTENTSKRVTSGAIKGDGTLALGYYYDREEYTVTFNNNGGLGTTTTSIRYDGDVAHLTPPTRPGYNFGGWYKDEGLTNPWNYPSDSVTTNTPLYARWDVPYSDSNDDYVYQPPTEAINVNVETGKLGQEVVNKTPITRTTDVYGRKNDKVTFTPESAKESIKSIKEMGQNIARVVIPDKKDEVSSIDFTLPNDTKNQIMDSKVNLEIYTENVKLQIPPSSLANLDKDLYFRFIPIKEEPLRLEVEERARVEKIVIQIAEGQKVNVVSRPMTIETNMQSRAVGLVMPLKDVVLPTNAEEREKYLSDLVIFIEHSDGEKELIKPQVVEYSEGVMGLQFGVNKFSTFTILNMEGYYAYLQTQAKSHKSYIKGYVDGTFKPEQSITRAEMAAILARNLEYDATKTVTSSYPDLQASHWALKEIEFVKTTGLMTGDAKGTFRPDSQISRSEMAAIAARYKKLDTTSFTKTSFIDVEASYWGIKEIEAVRTAGIVDGYIDNTYKPNNSLTRAEAVKIVNRLFERGPLYGVTTPSWPDVISAHWSYMEVEEASKSHNYTPRQVGGEDVIYLGN